MNKRAGFTIVELLIVIVVIAILAAITVVAYNGIQDRAKRSAVASYANGAIKQLQLYKETEGNYPTFTACVGNGFTNQIGTAAADCRWTSGGAEAEKSSTFDGYLASVATSQPTIQSDVLYNSGNTTYVQGGYYNYLPTGTLDSEPQRSWFVYLTFDDNCPVGPIARISSWPNYTMSGSYTNSEPWGTGSLCWIPLR